MLCYDDKDEDHGLTRRETHENRAARCQLRLHRRVATFFEQGTANLCLPTLLVVAVDHPPFREAAANGHDYKHVLGKGGEVWEVAHQRCDQPGYPGNLSGERKSLLVETE
jgi:hypothetical protein